MRLPDVALLAHAPRGNPGCGTEVDGLEKFRSIAAAKPRFQSIWSKLDDIRVGICRAGYHVVDVTIRQNLPRGGQGRQHQPEKRGVAIVVAMVRTGKDIVAGFSKDRRSKVKRSHYASLWKSS